MYMHFPYFLILPLFLLITSNAFLQTVVHRLNCCLLCWIKKQITLTPEFRQTCLNTPTFQLLLFEDKPFHTSGYNSFLVMTFL